MPVLFLPSLPSHQVNLTDGFSLQYFPCEYGKRTLPQKFALLLPFRHASWCSFSSGLLLFIVFASDQSVTRTDWSRPEVSIHGAGQMDRSLWGRECVHGRLTFSYPELRSSWPAPRTESSGRDQLNGLFWLAYDIQKNQTGNDMIVNVADDSGIPTKRFSSIKDVCRTCNNNIIL